MPWQRPFRLLVVFALMLLLLGACRERSVPAAPLHQQPAQSTVTLAVPTKSPSPTPTAIAANPSQPLTLKVASASEVTTWDPVESFSTEAAYLANIYEQLLRINPPGAKARFTPLLAERWEHNADGTKWTFYLRKGVTFHDGEPLTAQAVKMSIEAAAHYGSAAFMWTPLDHIEVVDEHTVRFYLKHPAPLERLLSASYGAWIVSPKMLRAAAKNPDYFQQAAARGRDGGTGPYTLAEYTPHQKIVLTRFDDYWRGWHRGQFTTVLIDLVPQATAQLQLLQRGEVDLVTRIPPEKYPALADDPRYQVFTEPSAFSYLAFFNTLHPPLDQVKVRQALAYATPYDKIIDLGVYGLGTPSRGPVPRGIWPWSAEVKQYHQDLDKARQLLAEAGYPHGLPRPLKLSYASENAAEAAVAPLIQQAYARIGVEVNLVPLPWNRQWELAKVAPEDPDTQDIFLMLYWPAYSDGGADNLWTLFHSSKRPFLNLSYWENEAFDRLLTQAAAETVGAPEKARQDYAKAMNLLVDETPALFLFDAQIPFVIPKYIHGFQYNLNYPFVPYDFYALTSEK